MALNKSQLGILCAFLGTLTIGLMDACIKWLIQKYPVGEIIFFKSIFSFIPLYLWIRFYSIKKKTTQPILKVNNYSFVVIRAIISFLAFACFVVAFSLMPLSEVTAISYSMPLFTAIISIFYLSEKLTQHRFISLFLSTIGMLIIIRPGMGVFQEGALFALMGSFLFAIMRNITRKYGQHETMEAMTIWVFGIWAFFSGLTLLYQWEMPVQEAIILFVAIGILGGLVEIFITLACQMAPASVVGMVQYTLLFWATFFDYFIWNRYPDTWTLAGVGVVICSTAYLAMQERKVKV